MTANKIGIKNTIIINLTIIILGLLFYIGICSYSSFSKFQNDENSVSYIAPRNRLGNFYPNHNKKKKQILVLGYYGALNYGDEIMLYSLLPTLDPNAEISVMFQPSARYNFEQFDSVFQYYPPKNKDIEKIADFYDELIVGGGAHIDDNFSNKLPQFILKISKEMLNKNKEVRWIAVSANKKFKNKNYVNDIKYIIKNSKEFSVRDTYSQNLLIKLGFDKNKIKLTKDLALNHPKRKTISVTLINYFDEDYKMVNYIQEIVNFAKDSKENYQICFLTFYNQNHADKQMYEKLIKQVDF